MEKSSRGRRPDDVRYTVSDVYRILLDGSDDADEVFDLQVGLAKLSIQKQTFLRLLMQGHTGTYAMHESGLQKNLTRLRREIIKELTDLINGEDKDG